MKGNLDNKSIFKEWLEKLQQESWQLELLISGLALYGIYESRTILLDFEYYTKEQALGIFSLTLRQIHLILTIGWKIFFFNLLIHVILRGLWIGAIGLRYISGDINYGELNYSERFQNHLSKRIGNYDDFIERLERICSVLFAFTFLIFLLFVSVIAFSVWMLIYIFIALDYGKETNLQPFHITAISIYFFFGFIVFVDFITIGRLKKIKEPFISKVYLRIYQFYSILTLSFLYRPLLYNFLDHKYTRRLFFLFIPYLFFISFGSSMFNSHKYQFFEDTDTLGKYGMVVDDANYLDLRKEKMSYLEKYDRKAFQNKLPSTVLSQYYVDEEYASIFFRYSRGDRALLEDQKKIEPIFKSDLYFTWSNDGRKEDENITKIKAEQDSILELTNAESRAFRKQIRAFKKSKDSINQRIYEFKKDSILEIRKTIQNEKKKLVNAYRENQYQEILDYTISNIDIHIDSVHYMDSLHCKYYIHPNNNEKGILCHFPTSALATGPHDLQITRMGLDKFSKDKMKWSYTFPFIKLNTNGRD